MATRKRARAADAPPSKRPRLDDPKPTAGLAAGQPVPDDDDDEGVGSDDVWDAAEAALEGFQAADDPADLELVSAEFAHAAARMRGRLYHLESKGHLPAAAAAGPADARADPADYSPLRPIGGDPYALLTPAQRKTAQTSAPLGALALHMGAYVGRPWADARERVIAAGWRYATGLAAADGGFVHMLVASERRQPWALYVLVGAPDDGVDVVRAWAFAHRVG